jgi:threonylcarbamoyladenosine tRNA methylthiotransferase MtaB
MAHGEGDTRQEPLRGRERPRVALVTFGCRVNQYETDVMRARLAPTCDLVDRDADVYVINGCSVTALAERKARQAARRLRLAAPGATLLVVGCLGEAVARGLSPFPHADLVAGRGWTTEIAHAVAAAYGGARGLLPAREPAALDAETTDGDPRRVRAVLKVQDGCSGACAYCRPVRLRGASRSKGIDAAVAEARGLVAQGVPEIVLTGVNLAEYAPPAGDLARLARRLLEIPDLARLRLASLNVSGVSSDLLDVFVGDRRFAPHFHLPLQSGDDQILRAMRRTHTAATYLRAVDRVRERLPEATFGADVLVGFPGEDEDAFAATCRVVEAVGYANLHIFRYSPRAQTEAAGLPNAVPEATKQDRAARLDDLAARVRRRVLDARRGKAEDVLVEARRAGGFCGHTAGYLETWFAASDDVPIGSVCRVLITGATDPRLEGVKVDPQHPD